MNNQALLIRLESRRSRALVVALALVVAGALACVIVRPVVAQRLAMNATSTEDLARAAAWDPNDPAVHIWLGHAYERQGDLDRARARFEEARRLRPSEAYPVMQLGLLAERRRDPQAARDAIRTALALDPHNVAIRWDAALLALRLDDREQALDHLRYVLAVDPAQRDAAFQLGRALLRPDEDSQILLPSDPDGLTTILTAALEHDDLPLANVAWARRVSLGPPFPGDVGRRYLQRLLEDGEGPAARAVWSRLIRGPATDDNAVWNGGFEADRLLGWGFDWRIQRVWGVDVALDSLVAARGRRSLRLTFNSFPTLDFAGVSQLVAVEPGREYQLEARARASGFATRSGVKLEVVLPEDMVTLAETSAIAGTTEWIPLTASVRIPDDTSLVMLRVRRERSAAPEGNLGGKVWIDEVSLR